MVAIGRSSKRRMLGVSLGERALAVAEVAWNGGGPRIVKAAEYRYPAGVTLADGTALGGALKHFLRDAGFAARQAVVGLPARWLISRAHVVPPADAETVSSMLRLRGEAESAAELGEMVFDYAGQASESVSTNVLLVGLPRRRLESIEALAKAAGWNLAAVTASAMALPGAGSMGGMVLSVHADGAELVARDGGDVRLMRHLGAGTNGGGFVAELRRAGAVLAAGRGAGDELVVWDEVGLDGGALDSIRAAVGTPMVAGDLGRIGVALEPGVAAGAVSMSAVALAAQGGLGNQPAAIDFLHPRITAPATAGVSRRTVWLSAGAAAVLLIGALAYADLSRLGREVAETEQQLKQLDPAYKLAKPFVADMKYVETFAGGGPRNLACLRDVTAALPEGGQAYLTSFVLRANLQGDLIGRAATSQDVLNLLEKLNAGGRFVGLRRKIDARGTGNDVSFSVTFTYVPQATAAGGREAVVKGDGVTDVRTPG